MEFTKDINFSANLEERKTVKITYSGDLFKKGSDSVTIVYGFGDNWSYTTEQEMAKIETGFITDVEMKESFDKFNFCFRNSNYEWDNNNNSNYVSQIAPLSLEELLEPKDEINEELIIELLDSLLNENVSYIEENVVEPKEEKQQILDEILTTQPTENNTDYIATENFDMDQLIENILNPVINCETSEVEEVQETMGTLKYDDIFADIEAINEKYSRAAQFFAESTIVPGTPEPEVTTTTTDVQEPSLLEFEQPDTTTSLVETAEKENKYLVSPRQLSRFYLIKKKIKLAFYKLFVAIPKLLSGEYNKSND